MRISDWSSDVCSSDLEGREPHLVGVEHQREQQGEAQHHRHHDAAVAEHAQRAVDQLAVGQGVRVVLQTGPDLLTGAGRSEEHTSELQSLMRISYAVFCLKKNKRKSKSKTAV